MSDLQLLLTRLDGGKRRKKNCNFFRLLNVGLQFVGLSSPDSLRASKFRRHVVALLREQQPGCYSPIWLSLLLPPVFFSPPLCCTFICYMHYSTEAVPLCKLSTACLKSLCKHSLFFKTNEERGDGCACFAAVLVAARRQHKHDKTARFGSCYANDAGALLPLPHGSVRFSAAIRGARPL